MATKPQPVSTQMAYGHVKGSLTRHYNACHEVVNGFRNVNVATCPPGAVAHLENLLSRVENSLMRLEAASEDMLGVWGEEEYKRENNILEEQSEKVRRLRLTVIDLTTRITAARDNSAVVNNSDHPRDRPVRINDSLKPEKLTLEATLAEFRAWQTNFDLFYSSNHMERFPLEEQQGYLRSCLDLKLSQILSTKIQAGTTIRGEGGCIDALRQIFLQLIPVLTRRYNFFKCDQKAGEKFSDWFLRLQLEGQEAELNTINEDYLYVLRLVTGTKDKRLREEFLRQTAPTRDSLHKIGLAWESAANVETSLDSEKTKSSVAITKFKHQKNQNRARSQSHGRQRSSSNSSKHFLDTSDLKDKCAGCGKSNPSHRRRDCPAFNKTCSLCGRRGHFQSVCTGGRLINGSNRQQETPRHYGGQPSSKARPVETSVIRIKSCKEVSDNSTPLLPIVVVPKSGMSFSMPALPDTGATESLISSDLVSTYGIPVDKSGKLKIVAANDTQLSCLGSVSLKVFLASDSKRQNEVDITAYVTSDLKDEFILSWHHLISLGVIPKNFPNVHARTCSSSMSTDHSDISRAIIPIFDQYSSVFEQPSQKLMPMVGKPMHIYLKEDINIKPTHVTVARNIPFAYRDKAEQEISFMVSSGIIEPVSQPSTWTSPCLVVPKPSGSVRLVVDYTGLNQIVKRPEHPFPTPQDLATSIPPDSKYFVVLDAVKGYWQIPLDEPSRELTTFLTPFGRYRYCRAPMGLNASGDEYCRRGDQALSGLKGVKKIVDDILIHAPTLDELIVRTSEVLRRCQEHGITLSRQKAQHGSTVKFAGFIISSNGVSPDPDKLAAITRFPAPTNLTELRSFLGLSNQLGQFVPDLAHAAQPLRSLLKKNIAFQWLEEHQRAFENVKNILTSPNGSVLAHFNSSLPTTLLTDASRLRGLGFVLLQTNPDGTHRLIQCGSRFLSDAETRYAVCELEALAIQWAILKCRLYLSGIKFKVITDHKPLLGIFRGSNLDAIENPRLQRILQRISGYTFDISWIAGKDHLIADALSRAPIFNPDLDETQEEETDLMIITVKSASSSEDPDLAMTRISDCAKSDAEYLSVIQCLLKEKHPKDLPASHPARAFVKVWQDLSFDVKSQLLILHNHRIVVPKDCRADVLEALHRAHQGVRRTRARARELYYWPNMVNDITQIVTSCQECASLLPSQPLESLQQSTAIRPFQSVSADLFECSAKTYLVLVDRYSGWPLVHRLNKTSTSCVTRVLQEWFCEYGIPERIRTDGGPQFRSEFDLFCKEFNISHELSSPYHPQSNGHAEAAVKAMKHLLLKSTSWTEFHLNLLEWRNIPRSDGLSPAQWLFGRQLRTPSPAHQLAYSRLEEDEFRRAELRREAQGRGAEERRGARARDLQPLHPGELVWIQDQKSRKWDFQGKIINARPDGRSYLIDLDGRTIIRNRRFLRKRFVCFERDC
jgi:hypothetical protein